MIVVAAPAPERVMVGLPPEGEVRLRSPLSAPNGETGRRVQRVRPSRQDDGRIARHHVRLHHRRAQGAGVGDGVADNIHEIVVDSVQIAVDVEDDCRDGRREEPTHDHRDNRDTNPVRPCGHRDLSTGGELCSGAGGRATLLLPDWLVQNRPRELVEEGEFASREAPENRLVPRPARRAVVRRAPRALSTACNRV